MDFSGHWPTIWPVSKNDLFLGGKGPIRGGEMDGGIKAGEEQSTEWGLPFTFFVQQVFSNI